MKSNVFKTLALIALLTRLYALFATKGMTHYDNLYQLLEPAHTLVYGYGITPWEYAYGMRSWLQPLMISIIFRAGTILYIKDINHLIFLNRIVMTAFSLTLLYVTYETASTLYNHKTGIYSLFFATFSGLLWVWSADTNSSIPATLYTTTALVFFYMGWRNTSGREYFISGLSLGIAFMFRFDSMIFLIPLTLYIIGSRRFAKTGFFVGGLAVMLLLQGGLDYLMLGSFLHSPSAFIGHNIFQRKSALFGTQPFYFYVVVLALHLSCLFLLSYGFERNAEFAFLSLNALVFFMVYSLIPHKEIRFLTPVLPLFFILAGRGMENAVNRQGRLILYTMAALTVMQGVLLAFDLGWQNDWNTLNAMNYVGRQSDATGVAYTVKWFESGAYTYLHKRIPAVLISRKAMNPLLEPVDCGKPDPALIGFQCSPPDSVIAEDRINYVISNRMEVDLALSSKGFTEVADFNGVSVYRRVK
jgi:phosphatidylinositol glycan class B